MTVRNDSTCCPTCDLLREYNATLKESMKMAQEQIADLKHQNAVLKQQNGELKAEVAAMRHSREGGATISQGIGLPPADSAAVQTVIPESSSQSFGFPVPSRYAPEGVKLLQLAREGDVDAALDLAKQLDEGVGGIKDAQAATVIYDHVSRLELPLDRFFAIGQQLDGVGRDDIATRMFQCCVKGETDKVKLLSLAESFGEGSARDKLRLIAFEKAEEWRQLAGAYRRGLGCQVNEVKAADFYWKAVESGDIEAALELGVWFGERGSMVQARQAFDKCGLGGWVPWGSKLLRLFHADGQVDVAKFHSTCDGRAPTLFLCKTRRQSLLGGFTTVPWGGSLWKQDPKAFGFILRSPKLTEPLRLRPLPDLGVYQNGSFGPSVGGIFVGGGSPVQYKCLAADRFVGISDVTLFDGSDDGMFEPIWVDVWQVIP